MTTALDVSAIQEAIKQRYTQVAGSAHGQFAYPTGEAGARQLGYDMSRLGDVPDDVLAAFCGVGNPFSLGAIRAGEAVLDVGCGAGFDSLVAGRLVGPQGRVCGLDLTPAMARQAQQNLRRAGVCHGSVVLACAEAIPYAANTFDVVISNGVLNLSPLKAQAFGEIYRVLKPQGRLQCADIVLQEALPAEVANNLDAWSN